MISIIVPIYNVAQYLPKCLDSLLNQTYENIEIICVNDGATDGSSDILEKYAAKDKRIKIITQKNEGLSGARNTGIKAANGEWTMFVDSDDWIAASCCQTLIEKTESNHDLYIFNYIRERENNSYPKYIFEKEEITFEEEQTEWLFKRLIAPNDKELVNPDKLDSLSTAWGKLYKTRIIKEKNIQFVSTKEIGTEDLLFNIYYFTYIKSAFYIPSTLYHYRKNNITSLTKLYKPHLPEQWENLFRKIEKWLVENKIDYQNTLNYRRALSIIGLGLNEMFAETPIKSKYNNVKTLLNRETYKKSVKTLPLKYFPVHWKLFFFAAKQRNTFIVMFMLRTIKKIISK